MITQLLLDLFFGLVSLATAVLPNSGPPGWVSDLNGYIATAWESGQGLGVWIPWSLVATVVAALLASMVLGLTIKIVRIVASFLTAGGGSAA